MGNRAESAHWIVVANWARFQHYHDRAPAWVKLYTELQSRDDWLDLSDAERGLLVTIWIEFARAEGRLKVARVLAEGRNKNRRRALERLRDAGWITFSASRPLALARARARSRETEKRRPPKPPAERGARKSKTTGWKLVRGSHGVTHIPDLFGTDRPPADAPSLKEMH